MYHIKKDKRSVQSSNLIYESLKQLMKEKEYNEITITELVEMANIGRATFYRNFDCLDDVLKLKSHESFKNLYKYLIDYYESISSKSTLTMPIFLTPFLRYWYIDSSIIELLMEANRIDIINESFIDMLKLFKPHLDKSHEAIWNHMDYFIAVRCGVSVNILIQWIKNNKNIPPDDLANLIITQFKEPFTLNIIL